MGVIYYDIASIVLLLLNLYLYRSRSKLFISRTKVFHVLLWISLASVTMDIVSVVAYMGAERLPLVFHYAVNNAFYAAHNSIPFVFFLFLLSLTDPLSGYRARSLISSSLPWVLSQALIASTPWTGLVYQFTDEMKYLRGSALPILYASALGYVLMGLVWLLTHRKRIPGETHFAVFLFLPFSLIPVIVQFFIPHLLIQSLGIAVSELFIILTIQDFGRYMDRSTGLFNRSGFAAQFSDMILSGKNATIILIVLDNSDYLRNSLGLEAFASLERTIIKDLFGPARESRFSVRFDAGSYAIAVWESEQPRHTLDRVKAFFSSPVRLAGMSVALSPRFCLIRIPNDTRDPRRVFQALHELQHRRADRAHGAVLTMEDLSLADTGRQRIVAQAVRDAIAKGSFQLHYQPIVDVPSNRIAGAECLLRLIDDNLGPVSPAEFIPIAEQNGTIHRVGDFVLEEACRFKSELRALGVDIGQLKINLSQVQCVQPNLAERIFVIARRYGLVPEELCFEITETSAGISPEIMRRNMDSLVSAGFSLAIDDFGTGYSNMSMLLELQFSVIKLDRSIVAGVSSQRERKRALESIISMLAPLSCEFVAEGVETELDRRVIAELGVRYIQGFVYARPMDETKFLEWVQERGASCI